ncbi:hypothetical protein D3218_13840 [Aureimonas flava]|uniref:Sel1 repeat family protein n=2 Tax=Aureimonas flava TaxID=2320271 RepID=A0A3A1WHQ2_9HYPH|nr:hypothetical protein D3218_13840 [Aureimonas flava]
MLLLVALLGATPAATAAAPPCGDLPLEACAKARPAAARLQLQGILAAGPDGYAARLLGDLTPADQPAEAAALYRLSYESGDLWGGIAYAKRLGSGQGVSADPSAAIAILERAADASSDAAPFVLYDAAMLRSARAAPGDEAAADALHVRAARLGNVWSTIPLAHRLAGGTAVGIGAGELAERMEAGLRAGDLGFARHGRVALARLRLRLETREAEDRPRGLALLAEVEAMGGEEGRRAGVERAVRLLESGSRTQKAEARRRLEAWAGEGLAPALFALGRIEAQRPDGERGRMRAVRRLEAAMAKDPSLQAYGWYLVGDAWRESRRADGAARARRAYVRAAENGNGWAEMRLAEGRAFGSLGGTSPRLARLHAERAARSATPEAGLAALLMLQGTPHDASGRRLLDQAAATLRAVPAERVAEIVASASDNGRVRFAQAVWQERGLYDGPVDGLATRRTMRVFASECRRLRIAQCRDGLMPAELVAALVASIPEPGPASSQASAPDHKS